MLGKFGVMMKKSQNEFRNNKKKNIIYFMILFFDIVMVIYCAKQNKVHYVDFGGKSIFVGKTKDMLLGRNYVNCIITLFFYCYYLVIERFLMKNKLHKKKVLGSLFLLVFITLILFYCFTVRVY